MKNDINKQRKRKLNLDTRLSMVHLTSQFIFLIFIFFDMLNHVVFKSNEER